MSNCERVVEDNTLSTTVYKGLNVDFISSFCIDKLRVERDRWALFVAGDCIDSELIWEITHRKGQDIKSILRRERGCINW